MAQAFDPIEQAMIETNREIAAEAWDTESVPLDTDNDRTPESLGEGLEGQHVEDEDADEAEAGETEGEDADGEAGEAEGEGKAETEAAAKPEDGKPAPKVEAQPEEKPNGRVPSARLREQTERARALETERDALKTQLDAKDAEHRKVIDGLNAKFDGVLAAMQRQQQPAKPNGEDKPEVVTPPDLFENPTGFVDHITKGFATELSKRDHQMQLMRVDMSMQVAHAIHKDVFEKAVEAAKKLSPNVPEEKATADRIFNAPNPGEALVSWFRRSEALREVGEDPAAYKQRIIDEERKALMANPEFRKQVIADLEAEARGGPNGKPNTITRLPKSLAAAAGSARVGQAAEDFDGSEQAIANSAWRD